MYVFVIGDVILYLQRSGVEIKAFIFARRVANKMSRGGQDLDCKVYVGNLPRDVTERELEIEFERFGA